MADAEVGEHSEDDPEPKEKNWAIQEPGTSLRCLNYFGEKNRHGKMTSFFYVGRRAGAFMICFAIVFVSRLVIGRFCLYRPIPSHRIPSGWLITCGWWSSRAVLLYVVSFYPIFITILFAEKAVELERQNFEVTSALALKDADIQRLREELEAATQVTMNDLTTQLSDCGRWEDWCLLEGFESLFISCNMVS